MYLFFFCYFPSSAPVYWCNICCHFRLWHLIHMEYQATQTTKMFITAYGQFSYLVSHFMSSHSTINLKLLIFWFWYDWHQSCCSFWLCTTFSLFIYLWIFGVHICLLHLCYAVRLFMLLNSLKRVYLYEQQVSPCERARKHWSLGTCKFLP